MPACTRRPHARHSSGFSTGVGRGGLATLTAAIDRFVTPDEFKAYETIAYAKGFLMVASSPLTRSSHHAGEDFARLRAARQAAAAR